MRIMRDALARCARFLRQLLRYLPFAQRRGGLAPAADGDETAHLLSSPANAARLYAALKRDRRPQPAGGRCGG